MQERALVRKEELRLDWPDGSELWGSATAQTWWVGRERRRVKRTSALDSVDPFVTIPSVAEEVITARKVVCHVCAVRSLVRKVKKKVEPR